MNKSAVEMFPKGHMTSPYGNTSDDIPNLSSLLDTIGLSKELFADLGSHVTSVMEGFDSDPAVIVVEIEGPNFKFDRQFDPNSIRTMSDGRRILVSPNVGTSEFILRHTTEDILKITKMYVKDGDVALLIFSGKKYALVPIRKFKFHPTIQ